MATLTKSELKTLKALLAKAEGKSPAKAKKTTTPPADPARHEATKRLLTWAKKTGHPRLAIKAEYAVSKGGYLNQSAFDWAKNAGFTG